MAHLSVRNFGPIQELELEIQDFMVLIGPNGSGKSTIAKLVYLFKEIPQLYFRSLRHLAENRQLLGRIDFLISDGITIALRQLFGWQESYHKEFNIQYTYKNNVWIKVHFSIIGSTSLFINTEFSSSFDDQGIRDLLYEVRTEKRDANEYHFKILYEFVENIFDIKLVNKSWQDFPIRFIPGKREIPDRFDNSLTPASLFAHQSVNSAKQEAIFDLLYLDRIVLLFRNSENNIGSRNILAVLSEISPSLPEDAVTARLTLRDHVAKLIGGGLGQEQAMNVIVLADGTKVPLSLASSGQQSVYGILVELTDILLKSQGEDPTYHACYVIIEEPESHLFPTAQKTLIEAIALAFNAIQGNQVLITTHSPYTLTVLNNLIAAWKGAHLKETGELNPATAEEIAKVIPQPTWLNPAQVGAYYVADGGITSIMTETGLIGENELDNASEVIMEDFDEIMDIRSQAGRGANT